MNRKETRALRQWQAWHVTKLAAMKRMIEATHLANTAIADFHNVWHNTFRDRP